MLFAMVSDYYAPDITTVRATEAEGLSFLALHLRVCITSAQHN